MFITDHFATLAPGYDAVLSDVWGVIHNGVAAFPAAHCSPQFPIPNLLVKPKESGIWKHWR